MNQPRIPRYRIWVLSLTGVMIAGLVAGVIVFSQGLIVTNLSDLVPWGLWITIDLSAIALSAGAFTLCAAVYLLNLKRYAPVARTATYIGLIGYSMAVLTLMLDIGRPDRFWHALVYWNPHSVLWEVTMCVCLYLGVLVLETAPILGEAKFLRQRAPKIAERLHSVHQFAPYLAIAGLLLSMLHQSSLGATYGVLKARPIWYRPGLSVLFIISAAAGGISLTVLASLLAARFNKQVRVERSLMDRLSWVVGWILLGYLYFRFWDAFSMTYTYLPGRNEGLDLLTRGPLALSFWLGEILLGTIVPIFILLNNRLRSRFGFRLVGLGLVVLGVIAYRWDTTLVGQLVLVSYVPHANQAFFTHYVPSLIEILSGAGIVAYGLLAFTLGVKYLRVVDHPKSVPEEVNVGRLLPAEGGAD